MRAVVCREYGEISRLTVEELETPHAGAGKVLVAVQAAGVNFPDGLMVQGKYQVKVPLPFTPGMEIAGTVTEVGPDVANLQVGDPVWARARTGGFATHCVVAAAEARKRPPELAAEVAAASVLTYGTTLHALRDRARLQAGETLLVLGAGGGVGTAAVELGRLIGARVIAAASSDDKLRAAAALGADATINYASGDLRTQVRAANGGKGIDVVYDPVGGTLAEPALRELAWGGRYLVIGFASGEIPKVPLNLALLNERSILGVYWGDWAARQPAESGQQLDELGQWLADGQLRPVISERVSLEDAPRAIQSLLDRRVTGKIVVVPQ